MKRKIVFKNTILLCVALMIFALISCGLLVYNDNKLLGENLIRLANGYSGALIVSTPEDVVKYDTNDEVRVTIIDADGKVLADSYGNVGAMDNHLGREEIVNASGNHNTKIVKRHSGTGNVTLLYFAKKVTIGDSYNFVRVAVASADVSIYLTTTIIIIFIMTVAIAVISGFMANAFTEKSLKPLEELSDSLDGLKNGNFHPMVASDDCDKLNMLISRINDIGEVVVGSMSQTAAERDKLNNMLDNMSQAVVAADMSGDVVICNPRAKELFKCENMLGKNMVSVMCETTLMDGLAKIAQGENRQVYFDKAKRNYLARIKRVGGVNGSLDTIVLVTDVTDIKLAERERREFFANASHELKTPLTAIKGYAELIGEGIAKGDKAQNFGNNISAESSKLLELINDMLTLSRLDEGIDIGTRITVSLNECAKNVLDKYQELIKARGLQISLDGDAKVKISMENVNSILSNVISNAIKYNKDGGRIDVSITTDGDRVNLKIADTGIGVDKKDLPRLTQRFYKVDSSRQEQNSTGLGLAIVKHQCELNGINLKIDSTLGIGTTVSLTFVNKMTAKA